MKTTPQLKVGLLGSGQLARMLALRAHSMGIIPYVYGGTAGDPAAQVSGFHISGDLKDEKALEAFLRQVDVATFESEFMNGALLDRLSKKTKVAIYPDPLQMEQLQDRLSQKNLLKKYKLASSEFIAVATATELGEASEHFKNSGMVLKKRKFGYDGYGTFILKTPKDIEKFKSQLSQTPEGFIAEKFVKFKRELALSAVRNESGEIVFLPLVESFQKNSRCFWVKGPLEHPRLAGLKNKIKKFLNALDYRGIMAFELFDTGKELLINEIAPRVHNSAHYSLDALDKDQFQLHLEALLNRPLKAPRVLCGGFAMVNLLGSGSFSPAWSKLSIGQMHWYGKHENRDGRKMGHINVCSDSASKALKLALKTLGEIKL